MNFKVEKGNLFELNKKYALCHCISLDAQMDEGIAKEFKKRFKGMQSDIRRIVADNELKHPVNIYYYSNNRCIINLITKKKYWNKPTYRAIEHCIEKMAKYCKKHDIKYLGMPKIGCGLDKLQWGLVRQIIIEKFEDIDIDIVVRYL